MNRFELEFYCTAIKRMSKKLSEPPSRANAYIESMRAEYEKLEPAPNFDEWAATVIADYKERMKDAGLV